MNAADVVAALRVHYGAGYALVEQVGDSTGYRVSRHLDVIALGLWPSRGHDLHGIEVKVSKADFKRELSTPIKAEAVADRCDRFYIAAPAGVADQNLMDLLTPGWGLLEVNEATTGKRTIKVARAAKQLEAKPVTRDFLAAILRRIPVPTDKIRADIEKSVRENYRKEVDEASRNQAARLAGEAGRTMERVAKFEELTGIRLTETGYSSPWGMSIEDIGEAVLWLARQKGYGSVKGQFEWTAQTARSQADHLLKIAMELEGAIAKLPVPYDPIP